MLYTGLFLRVHHFYFSFIKHFATEAQASGLVQLKAQTLLTFCVLVISDFQRIVHHSVDRENKYHMVVGVCIHCNHMVDHFNASRIVEEQLSAFAGKQTSSNGKKAIFHKTLNP